MNYKFIPNSYKLDENTDYEKFLKKQILYRKSFEAILCKYIDFQKIDERIKSLNLPIVYDKDYNFYHKFSSLNSEYIYLRNNIHVERLNKEEDEYLENCLLKNQLLDFDCINKTYSRVLFEDGEKVFCGSPTSKNMVDSKSIIIEFAYNQIKCNIEQILNCGEVFEIIKESINSILVDKLNLKTSYVIYNSIPDEYKLEIEDKIVNFR